MKKIGLILIIGYFSGTIDLSGQQTPKYIYDNQTQFCGYLEYLPPGYDTSTLKYPVLVFLHGALQSGDGSPEDLEILKECCVPMQIENGHDMCFTINDKKECFIVISPQALPTWTEWFPSYVNIIMNHILTGPDNYRIDPDHIYITGFSAGGNGIWAFAQSDDNHPNILAAVAPVSGWMPTKWNGCNIAWRRISARAFHGRNDIDAIYQTVFNNFNQIIDCKTAESKAEYLFTTYEDKAHDIYTEAFSVDHSFQNPNMYEWLLQHERDTVNDIPTGIENNEKIHFSVIPNPARDMILIDFDNNKEAINAVSILNLAGEYLLYAENPLPQLDISSIPPGLYIIRITDHSGIVTTTRLIKIN